MRTEQHHFTWLLLKASKALLSVCICSLFCLVLFIFRERFMSQIWSVEGLCGCFASFQARNWLEVIDERSRPSNKSCSLMRFRRNFNLICLSCMASSHQSDLRLEAMPRLSVASFSGQWPAVVRPPLGRCCGRHHAQSTADTHFRDALRLMITQWGGGYYGRPENEQGLATAQ